MSDKTFHSHHRQRMRGRFEAEGADGFETHELLELFLFDAIPRVNTNTIAHRLLDRFGSLEGVFKATEEELCSVKGIGPKAAGFIKEKWRAACTDIEERLRALPLVSFERAANFLIWHGFLHSLEDGITVVLLDGNMFAVDVIDLSQTCNDFHKNSIDAVKAIIGVRGGKDCRQISDILSSGNIEIVDVISVDGFSAESNLKYDDAWNNQSSVEERYW